MTDFTIQPCADKGGLSAKLTTPRQLDIKAISKTFKTIIETPHVLVVEVDGHEIIVHGYGELIFKTLTDEDEIRAIAERIYRAGIPTLGGTGEAVRS